jgi:hypothetical protein
MLLASSQAYLIEGYRFVVDIGAKAGRSCRRQPQQGRHVRQRLSFRNVARCACFRPLYDALWGLGSPTDTTFIPGMAI